MTNLLPYLRTAVFLLLVSPAFLTTSASAATFATDVQIGALSCDGGQTLNVANSAQCPSVIAGQLEATASASSGNGVVSARASSLSIRDANGVLTVGTGQARAFAIYLDTVQATYRDTGNAFNGSASFSLDLLGEVIEDNGATASASVNFAVNGTSLFAYDSATASSGPDSVTPATTGNVIGGTYNVFMAATAEANTVCLLFAGESCFSDSNLGSSLRITGLSFLENGEDVTDQLNVVSESGFDYVTGAAPHDRGDTVNAVPLPASTILFLSAFSGLIVIRRQQKRLT